ncbi:enoyl-CoA hydratase/isomerase family protein [Deferribacterales bacterium Es71-Z0220]|uniref:enoyl-CoA hydratase/isomerase family protein n=1 Tax=Deferrivibrio essentukiensis TaxID=2880922 RepID=UPI001F601640|nr:enoyl-CoA hydratase/isomerase family protein [Deferrivibrio essentukiensis]MCB4204325.1 enoyl-CoA hydratase/isomerase family protein [Deferrivibrio essentukiensis]
MIKTEIRDNIAYIILDNGENKQNIEFAVKLLEALDEVEKNSDATALVITSSDEKNWSQGVDLNFIMSRFASKDFQSIKDFLNKMNEVFKKILSYPIPVIAEITGHAFGNGALLACACDFRFMKNDKGFFCFPEVDVKIPFLPSMVEYAKKAVGFKVLQDMLLTGKRLTARQAEEYGILKSFDDLQSLKNGVFEFAKGMNKGRNIYKELKLRMYKDVLKSFEEDKNYIENLLIYYP